MNHIDRILEFLALRESSYTLHDVSKSVEIPHDVCKKIVHFLTSYDFVHLAGSKVKINPKIGRFMIATSAKAPLQTTS